MSRHKNHDTAVKESLVACLEAAREKKDFASVASLAAAYTKLRAVELKQAEGDYGDELFMPAQSNDGAQVRS